MAVIYCTVIGLFAGILTGTIAKVIVDYVSALDGISSPKLLLVVFILSLADAFALKYFVTTITIIAEDED